MPIHVGEIYFSANHRFLLITDLLAFKRYQPGRKVFVCLWCFILFAPATPSARIPPSGEFHIWLNWSYGVSFELISSVLEEGLFGFPWNVISFGCHVMRRTEQIPFAILFDLSCPATSHTLVRESFILLWIDSDIDLLT